MTPKDSISDRNMKDGMARDDTSGKKKLYKDFIYNEFTFTYASSYIKKNGHKCQKYNSHILRYMNIYEYMKYICAVIKRPSMIYKTISCSIFQ